MPETDCMANLGGISFLAVGNTEVQYLFLSGPSRAKGG